MRKLSKVCVIDNPNTHCRECWENGKMVWSISALAIETKGIITQQKHRPWRDGVVIGDKEAMNKS